MTGTIIGKKYKLLEQIGNGSFSVVYKCKSLKKGEIFAAKVMNITRMTKKRKSYINKEVRIHTKLKHENIIELIDFVKDQKINIYCVILEFLPHGDLFEVIVADGHFNEKQAHIYISQILSAFSYIHANDVIHRDFKPENVLVSSREESRIKITDFGLAIETNGDLIGEYGYAGTPIYMSPEMVCGEPYGKPIDIWSCGVVLFSLLTGNLPFWSKDSRTLEEKIKAGPPPLTTKEWEHISDEAKDLMYKMLTVIQRSRITAQEAIEHRWVKDPSNIKDKELTEVVENLRKFNALRKLRASILTTLALTMRSDSSTNDDSSN